MATSDIKKGPLYVDSTNNRVGIGTSSPNTNAEIVGGSTGSTTNLLQIRSNASTANTGSTIRFTNSEVASSAYGAAEITAFRIDVAGDTDLVFKPSKAGTISEAMRIQGDTGNVGIGTVPSNILHVSGTSGNPVLLERTNGAVCTLAFKGNTTTNNPYLGANGDDLYFNTGAGNRMTIDSSGGISKNGSFSYSGTSDDFYWNTGTGDRFRFHSGTTASRDILGFSNPNGVVGSIETNGSSTAYLTSSDYRLKTAVNYDWDATSRLKQLKPARFKWIADGDDAVFVDGFLAHECEAVPEAISGTKDAVDEDGNPEYQGIDQSKLVPLLVKTIQELEARITALEAN